MPLTPLMHEVIAADFVVGERAPAIATAVRITGWSKWVAKLQQASGLWVA